MGLSSVLKPNPADMTLLLKEKPQSSEGEEFLEIFFESVGIECQKERKIEGLTGDSKMFRMADFYLPEYKIYLEFFGQWNSPEHKDRYLEKKRVYLKNKIPCIYIYPENLGLIKYIFDKRLVAVLKEQRMPLELRKYRIMKIKRSAALKYQIVSIVLILSMVGWKIYSLRKLEIGDYILSTLFISCAIYLVYDFYKTLKSFLTGDSLRLHQID